MDGEKLQAKIEKWVEETPPLKRFIICFSLILPLSMFLLWHVGRSDFSSDQMVGVFLGNVIIFFFILVPLNNIWNKMKSQ